MSEVETRKRNRFREWTTLTKSSLKVMFRNPTTLFFGFFFPFIFISVFGLLSTDISFEVVVREDSDVDNIVITALEEIGTIDLIYEAEAEEDIDDQLLKGQIAAIIDVQKDEATGQLIVNAEYSSAEPDGATVVGSIINGIADKVNFAPYQDEPKQIVVQTEVVEGREFTQIDFILPGQLGFALLSSGMFGIAFTFITLRKQLVIKRLFATPTSKMTIIMSEVFAKLVYAMIQAAVIIIVGVVLFNYTLVDGFVTFVYMMIMSAIALLVFLGFGFFVAGVANDENSAPPIANLITLPQFLLSGAFFPIAAFPEFLQPIARILPLTFLNDALRQIGFEGANLLDVLPEIAGLIVWGVIIYIVAIKLFKWE